MGTKFQQVLNREICHSLVLEAFDKLDTDAVTLELNQFVDSEICKTQPAELSNIVSFGWGVCLLPGGTSVAGFLGSALGCILQIGIGTGRGVLQRDIVV